MWTTQDQVEAYILKYKEELFRHSEDSKKNQELIERLKEYFRKAKERGDVHLQEALDKLASPSVLATRHLKRSGIHIKETRSFFLKAFFVFSFLIFLIIIGSIVFSFWFLSDFKDHIGEDGFQYSIYFEEKHFGDEGIERVEGNYPLAKGKRLIIEGETLNINIYYHLEEHIYYECKWEEKEKIPLDRSDLFSEQNQNIIFHLTEYKNALSCDFTIPKTTKLNLSSHNLRLNIEKLLSETNITSKNAYIDIGIVKDKSYKLDLRVDRALVLNQSKISRSEDGTLLFIEVENGKIDFNL